MSIVTEELRDDEQYNEDYELEDMWGTDFSKVEEFNVRDELIEASFDKTLTSKKYQATMSMKVTINFTKASNVSRNKLFSAR